MFEYDKSQMNREQFKRFVLEHSLTQMDDKVRSGRISLDEHAMASCAWKYSRHNWDIAKQGVLNQVPLGYLSKAEAFFVLSVLAEICPSRFD